MRVRFRPMTGRHGESMHTYHQPARKMLNTKPEKAKKDSKAKVAEDETVVPTAKPAVDYIINPLPPEFTCRIFVNKDTPGVPFMFPTPLKKLDRPTNNTALTMVIAGIMDDSHQVAGCPCHEALLRAQPQTIRRHESYQTISISSDKDKSAKTRRGGDGYD